MSALHSRPVEIWKEFSHESAHRLPNVPADHKCARMHGHSFKVEVHVRGDLHPEIGWVVDFADIGVAWRPLHDALDHRCLNDVPGLENPTSELLAKWIWARLKPTLPGLAKVVVRETCTSGCAYTGD